MRVPYRLLLRLYPGGYRNEFGDEMATVFDASYADAYTRGISVRLRFLLRECAGVMAGACDEHLRALGFSPDWFLTSRRFNMRSNFRYPRTTIVLMILILGIVIGIIEKARGIMLAMAHTNAAVRPLIDPVPFPSATGIIEILMITYIIGASVWAIVFAFRRSGVHRLSAAETWTRR